MVKAKETQKQETIKRNLSDLGTREIFKVKDGANTDGSEFFSLTGNHKEREAALKGDNEFFAERRARGNGKCVADVQA